MQDNTALNPLWGKIQRVFQVECAECGRWIVIPGKTAKEAAKHLRTTEHWKCHKRLYFCPVCSGAAASE